LPWGSAEYLKVGRAVFEISVDLPGTYAVRATGSGGAVDRDLKGCANGAHPNVGKPAKPADQDGDGHTFHGVQVHRRTAGDRVGIGFKYHLAG
jgi:hypothetical protein